MIELEKLDFIDATLDGEVKYNIENVSDNCYIELASDIQNKGTPINRNLFNKIQRLFEEAAVFLETAQLGQSFSVEKLYVVDEALNAEERYSILDAQGNILHQNCLIERSTPVAIEGTKIDKELFDKIDRNFDSLFSFIYWQDVGTDIYNFFTEGKYNGEVTPNLLDESYADIRGLD